MSNDRRTTSTIQAKKVISRMDISTKFWVTKKRAMAIEMAKMAMPQANVTKGRLLFSLK